MPELDPFDARLEAGIRGFADRALTIVDAAAVARQAAGQRRTGAWAVLGRSVPVPVSLIIVMALPLAFLAWSLQGQAPWSGPGTIVVPVSPTPVPTEGSPTLTPSPVPSTDGSGDEPVVGTEAVAGPTSGSGTVTIEGDVTHLRDVTVTSLGSMNDPRVAGAATWEVSADLRSGIGPAWGTYRLETASGAWEGTCTGSLWADGTAGTRICSLVGSGSYTGFTYMLVATWSDGSGDVRGVIVPGSLPAP